MIIPIYLVLWLLTLIALQSVVTANQCTELEKCKTLSWLNDMKGKTGFEEKKELFKCGNDYGTLVKCPEIQEGDNSNVILERDCSLEDGGCTDSSGTLVKEGEEKCQGSIAVYTRGRYDDSLGVSSYSGEEYPKFGRRLRKKIVYLFEVTGDCCWELYPRKNFIGFRDLLKLANGEHQESFHPRSIRKVFC